MVDCHGEKITKHLTRVAQTMTKMLYILVAVAKLLTW